MNLTQTNESTLNFLTESVSEQLGGIDFLMSEIETQLQYSEHRHSALQIVDALGRAKKELQSVCELSRNVVDGYYGQIVGNHDPVVIQDDGSGNQVTASGRILR